MRLVELDHGAVVPVFMEVGAAREETAEVGKAPAEFNLSQFVGGVGWRIYGAALRLGHGNITIGAEEIRGRGTEPRSQASARPERGLGRVLTSPGAFGGDHGLFRLARAELNHTAHGRRTVKAGIGAATYHFDVTDGFTDNAVPVDPSAERVIEGNVIDDD